MSTTTSRLMQYTRMQVTKTLQREKQAFEICIIYIPFPYHPLWVRAATTGAPLKALSDPP